jgi:hypothetical protein
VKEEGPRLFQLVLNLTIEAVAEIVAVCLVGAMLLMRGGTTRTISIMSKRIVTQNIMIVGLPMVMAIAARDDKDEMTMAVAMTACSVGNLAISKMNFMPEQKG